MKFEGLLKSELSKISSLNDNIYPLSVPESVTVPYISYCLSDGKYLETLDGSEPWELTYEINILTDKYSNIKDLEKNVTEILKTLKGKKDDGGTIKQVKIEVPNETYEEAVKLNRANIEFTICY